MKKYLYFTNPGNQAADGSDDNHDLLMIPADHVLGVSLPSSVSQTHNLTITSIDFQPIDGSGALEDFVFVNHTEGNRQKIIKNLVEIINSDKTNSPFIVVSDEQNGEYIDGIDSTNRISIA